MTTREHNAESVAAYRSVGDLTTRQRAVAVVVQAYGPLTDAAIAEWYARLRARGSDLPEQSASGLRTRRAELAKRGLVIDTGKRLTLPTGRSAALWAWHNHTWSTTP